MDNVTIDKIDYRGSLYNNRTTFRTSISPIGIDTEADENGKCFLFATSLGDVYSIEDFPRALFSRTYRQRTFVAYNLKYDMGALLQVLPQNILRELWENDCVEYDGFKYKAIGYKCLTVSRGKGSIHIYDMYNFYGGSLDYNAEKYLSTRKIPIKTKTFSRVYIAEHYLLLSYYCYYDAVIVERLALRLIKKFEEMGVYPRKLYSVAYISYQYFRTHTKYVTVKKFWDNDRDVLDFAIRSYNGGKFEVTRKGAGYYYEYDIISAYPAEIRNLIDITFSRIVRDKRYRKSAAYSFLDVTIKMSEPTYSPTVVKYGTVNAYPIGEYRRVITKTEYEYLQGQGAELIIHHAKHLMCDCKQYPYKKEIEKLVTLKQQYKREGRELDLHTVKIFLNSLYGKFVQLIESRGRLKASSCWNPIYASFITANTRVKITELQQQHPEIVAVHTDSIISTVPIDIPSKGDLGDMIYEVEGAGVIIGCGVYQVGNKSKIRGFQTRAPLSELIHGAGKTISIHSKKARSWREVAFHNWNKDEVNHFVDELKKLDVSFDRKRVWLNDYKTFREVLERPVLSMPLHTSFIG